jgi:beta-lactamase regulating signal transducer with metallopeptidase domain
MGEINVSGFLHGLGRTSVQAGVLVLVILVSQWLFRKQLTPRWRSALWLVVIGRLLLPISVVSAVSMFNLAPRWTQRPPMGLAFTTAPGVNSPQLGASAHGSAVDRFPQSRAGELPASEQANVDEQLRSRGVPSIAEPMSKPPPIRSPQHQFSWTAMLFWGWLLGALILAGHVTISSIRLARAVSGLPPLTDPAAVAVLAGCRARLSVGVPLTLVESGARTCPALYGFMRARLLLPKDFSSRFSEHELRFIFLHELAHLKRRDLPLNWVIALLQAVHWFNPLVWVAFAKWRVDRELACDSMALDASGGDQSNAYGRTILRLLEDLARPATAPGLLGILESKKQLQQRIRTIADYVPGRRWRLSALALVAAIAVTGLTDARDRVRTPNRKTPTPAPSSTELGEKPPAVAVQAREADQPLPSPVFIPPGFRAPWWPEEELPTGLGMDTTGLTLAVDNQHRLPLRLPSASKATLPGEVSSGLGIDTTGLTLAPLRASWSTPPEVTDHSPFIRLVQNTNWFKMTSGPILTFYPSLWVRTKDLLFRLRYRNSGFQMPLGASRASLELVISGYFHNLVPRPNNYTVYYSPGLNARSTWIAPITRTNNGQVMAIRTPLDALLASNGLSVIRLKANCLKIFPTAMAGIYSKTSVDDVTVQAKRPKFEPDSAANRRRLVGPETNQTSSAAGSRR